MNCPLRDVKMLLFSDAFLRNNILQNFKIAPQRLYGSVVNIGAAYLTMT